MRYSWDILNVRLGGLENPEITWLTAQPELCPRVAGEPTVWIAQKDHACYRREVPKRDDRSHANTLTVAPHICVVSRGTAQVLWRARLIVSLLGCKQECDELKVGGSHVEQHM